MCLRVQFSAFLTVRECVFCSRRVRKFVCNCMYERDRKEVNNCACMFMWRYVGEHIYKLLFRGSVYV